MVELGDKVGFWGYAIPTEQGSSHTANNNLVGLMAPHESPDWDSSADPSSWHGHNIGLIRGKSIDIASKISNRKEGTIFIEADSTVGDIKAVLRVSFLAVGTIVV